MGSTYRSQHDGHNPYHIGPSFFSGGQTDAGGSATSNTQEGRRQSSRPPAEGRPDSDMFRDADDEGVSGDLDFARDLLAFDPPPPCSGPPPSGSNVLSDPYEASRRAHDPQIHTRHISNGVNAGPSTGQVGGSPGMERDRLASSTSVSSMSSTLKGRRAPAPAALDLSPRREQEVKQNPYSAIGHGYPPTGDISGDRQLSRVSCILLYLQKTTDNRAE